LSALAHFQSTGLPISDVENNIVIYGHSSSGDYYERTKDIAGAFSRLNKIKVGDIVTLEMEGKTYNYRVIKTKIVEPYNTEIISGTPGKRTLTLFTCFPSGNNSQRFVAVANPI
jgi:sortase A